MKLFHNLMNVIDFSFELGWTGRARGEGLGRRGGLRRIFWDLFEDFYGFLDGFFGIVWITGDVFDFLMDRMGFFGILWDSVDNW